MHFLKKLSLFGALAGFCVASASVAAPDPENWEAVLAEAEGQTVYWNAWGGDPRINAYIEWAGDQIKDRYGVTLKHVKLEDTATAVAHVLGEKAAGHDTGGAIDLIWINGENFASMKRADLLFGPFAEALPNWRYVDVEGKPTVRSDFTVPTEGLEAPWGMAQVVFYYDTARVAEPPRSIQALADWAARNPGRFAYPEVPDFIGSTFLKQALFEMTDDASILGKELTEAAYAPLEETLFAYLNRIRPHLWRKGEAYPKNSAALRQLMADGETDIALAFNPAEASSAIANDELQDTVRSYVLEGGTIGNTHFVAIPYNANAKAGAMVLANFLMSPEAQLRKQDPEYWGDFTVLDMDALSEEERAGFAALDLGIATLSPAELGQTLPEPHPSWMTRIEEDWKSRYGASE